MKTSGQHQFKKLILSFGMKSFFKAMQEWIDSGCPKNNPRRFMQRCGLCSNSIYCGVYSIEDYQSELKYILHENNLLGDFPFNTSHQEYKDEEHYSNPMRLAFIKFYSED